MRIVVQRSKQSSVIVHNKIVGKIDKGLVLLIGFTHSDTKDDIDIMINKIVNLRIFDDEFGIMNKSVLDIGGNILSVSQFTLYADTKNGRRPSYKDALKSKEAEILYNLFNEKLKEKIHVETGIFGSNMNVSIQNDGPVTLVMESR